MKATEFEQDETEAAEGEGNAESTWMFDAGGTVIGLFGGTSDYRSTHKGILARDLLERFVEWQAGSGANALRI